MLIDVLKEYLVKLGFNVDEPGFNKAKGSIDNLNKAVGLLSSNSALRFAGMAAVVTGFVTVAFAALYKYTIGVAQADMQNQLFAARMWMNVDSAMAFKSSLDALGVSIQDLYLSPELMQRYNELNRQAGSLTPPGGYGSAMRGVRDIAFEWAKFKQEMQYGSYWIGYYLTKYLNSPLGGVKFSLKDINNWITQNIPKWSAKVAQGLSWIARMGAAAITLGKGIKSVWDAMGESAKKAFEIGAGIALVARLRSPLTWLIAGLTALLLLVDDYSTYQSGGKSAWPELWKWIDDTKQSLKDDGALQTFADNLDKIAGNAGRIVENLGKLFAEWDSTADSRKGVLDFFNALNTVLGSIADFLDRIANQLNPQTMTNGMVVIPQDQLPAGNGYQDPQAPPGAGNWEIFVAWLKRMYLQGTGMDDYFRGKNSPFIFQQQGAQQQSSNVRVQQQFYIASNGNPVDVANAVGTKTNAMLTRYVGGVVV